MSKDSASKRTPNFTHVEEKLLPELMEKHKRVIENKKSGAVQWSDKEKAWKQLEEEFNGRNIVTTFCSMTILKQKYNNLKKNSKNKFARNKQEMLKTGGGASEFVAINDVDLTFKSILGNQIDGLPAVYDSDDISSMYIIDFKHNFLL
jgi:hypothetical protein